MTPEVTTVTEDMTVQQVIDHLRAEAAEHESIYYIYVVEADRRLAGVISLRDLLMAAPETTVAEIAERDLFVGHVDDDQEDVAEQMSKYDLLALPVVDETGKLLGIVTVDDALDVMEEESAEDLAIATGSAEHGGPVASMLWWLLRRNAWLARLGGRRVRGRRRHSPPLPPTSARPACSSCRCPRCSSRSSSASPRTSRSAPSPR